jgi:hypothetical protein
MMQGSLASARVLLRHGARLAAPAFAYANVLCFAAGHGGSAGLDLLEEMTDMAPELVAQALEIAVSKARLPAVRVLIKCEGVAELGVWDMLLGVRIAGKDDEFHRRYQRVVDAVYAAGIGGRPSEEAVRAAVERDNVIGVERLLSLGVLESEEVAGICVQMGKRGAWDEMLEKYIA